MADTDRMAQTKLANDALLDEMAERVHRVMLAAFGSMQAPTLAQVRAQLAFSLEALEEHPEIEYTHGQISLERTSGVGYAFNVRLNLGTMIHFGKEASDGS